MNIKKLIKAIPRFDERLDIYEATIEQHEKNYKWCMENGVDWKGSSSLTERKAELQANLFEEPELIRVMELEEGKT